MKTYPMEAYMILQDMRHHQLILQLEEMSIPGIDTDRQMLDLLAVLAVLFGLPPSGQPDVWCNTYMLFMERVKDYPMTATGKDLMGLALECYDAMHLLARGMRASAAACFFTSPPLAAAS